MNPKFCQRRSRFDARFVENLGAHRLRRELSGSWLHAELGHLVKPIEKHKRE
jgi:hypothetical protein